jgi:hypothetical protein
LIKENFNPKALNDAGAISYYYTHEEEFNTEDSSVLKLKLYKAFEIMRKVSASRFSICGDDLSYKLDVLKPRIKDKKRMFDVDIPVTEHELKEIRTSSSLNKSKNTEKNTSLLDQIKKSYPEDERGKDDKQDERHENQKKKGDENENLVKSILASRNSITCIKSMKDYTGYDIQFKLGEELHRVEVKTIGDRLEFYITINELNNIFNSDRKNYTIEKIITRGIVFDIRHIKTGEVRINDIDLNIVMSNDFIMFYSGILSEFLYGSMEYFRTYVELSDELVDGLIARKVSFIGVDMAGAKGPQDHLRIDQYCADKGVFIIENLNNLDLLYETTKGNPFKVYTFPVNMSGFSGLPCRVVAEI